MCETYINTQLGVLRFLFEDDYLTELGFVRRAKSCDKPVLSAGISLTIRKIVSYLEEKSSDLDVDFRLNEGTEFQRDVWRTARTIPYGEVRTYGWIAQQIGRPGAARAVGTALARNPLLLVIPCHRVVSTNGLGGFSAVDGLESKSKLLTLEGAL
jgi:methylated-DNA-[protein]-cysteine S-methyltransferase